MKGNCLYIGAMLFGLFAGAMQMASAACDPLVVHATRSTTAFSINVHTGQLLSDERATQSGVRIFAQPGSTLFYSTHTGINLVHGRLLVTTKNPVVVRTKQLRVQLPAHTCIGLESEHQTTRVQSLHTSNNLTVELKGGEQQLIGLGEELHVSAHQPSDVELLPLDGVGRRRVSQTIGTNEQYCTVSAFSIASFLKYVPTAVMMRDEAKHAANTQNALDDVMKSCCAVEYILRNRTPYTVRQPGAMLSASK